MKIVFGYPAWTGEYGLFGHFAKRNSTWPPLNLALLAAVCEQAGHEAVILDAEANGWNKERLALEIIKAKPDVVGFTAYSPFFHLSADAAAEVKKLDATVPIIVGGPHVTIMKEKAMLPQFDYGFMGEAEDSLPEFLNYLSDEKRYSAPTHIQGLLYRDVTKGFQSTGERWLVTESMKKSELVSAHPLDRLPLPARHLLNMRHYKLGTPRGRNYFTSIQSARGCPWRCVFCCSDALKTTRYIMKSPRRFVEEMVDIALQFPYIKHLYIVDDVLTFWPEHITRICDLIDAFIPGHFTFESSTRANLVDDKLIARLAKSGLIRLSFGLETIDPVMRQTMQKKVPIDDYPKANRICAQYGVEAMNSLMIGLPGETRQTVEATINWVSEQKDIKQANLAIAIPYPGTEFHEMAVTGSHGLKLLSEDFSDYLRYGNAVTDVGDLRAQDLIELQNWGFVKIYMQPWRWGPVWKKHGTLGFVLQAYRVMRLIWGRWFKRWFQLQPVMRHPKGA